MIPFEYRTPKNLKEVNATLQEFGSDAKLIAGGTALVIMMKQRLVRPSCLVSLRSVRGLNAIELKNGGISIGGLATHREVEGSSLIRRRLPMLAETYHHVATLRIRNMATVGGGLAHADPNQDPPPSLIALGATIKATSANGSRTIALDEFFKDSLTARAIGPVSRFRPNEKKRAITTKRPATAPPSHFNARMRT